FPLQPPSASPLNLCAPRIRSAVCVPRSLFSGETALCSASTTGCGGRSSSEAVSSGSLQSCLRTKRRNTSRSLITVGLGVAALLFAGRYAFQIWKPLEQVITETAKKIRLSSYYKGGFEQKMSRRKASLILGVSCSIRRLLHF
uniref:Uncharacterized protein n=1 Tax=Callithrix jacchus TaxID=9483 RepID=A0A8I3VYZ2_CALJA